MGYRFGIASRVRRESEIVVPDEDSQVRVARNPRCSFETLRTIPRALPTPERKRGARSENAGGIIPPSRVAHILAVELARVTVRSICGD
jgi:hypothetical protein